MYQVTHVTSLLPPTELLTSMCVYHCENQQTSDTPNWSTSSKSYKKDIDVHGYDLTKHGYVLIRCVRAAGNCQKPMETLILA